MIHHVSQQGQSATHHQPEHQGHGHDPRLLRRRRVVQGSGLGRFQNGDIQDACIFGGAELFDSVINDVTVLLDLIKLGLQECVL